MQISRWLLATSRVFKYRICLETVTGCDQYPDHIWCSLVSCHRGLCAQYAARRVGWCIGLVERLRPTSNLIRSSYIYSLVVLEKVVYLIFFGVCFGRMFIFLVSFPRLKMLPWHQMKEKEMLYGVSFNIPLLHRANLKLSLFEMVPMCVYVCEKEWMGEREGNSEEATFNSLRERVEASLAWYLPSIWSARMQSALPSGQSS